MKIKILTSCSGLDFSYAEGEKVDAKADIAKDLIKAGYAEEIKVTAKKEAKPRSARAGSADADA